MSDALLIDRLQFTLTVTFHYIFPQLTMGLALLIVILKFLAQKTQQERYNDAARFWGKIFALNFAVGVVTGIPMEFQFGTNWAAFSRFAGGVIGQTLAMEGVFAFFLESSFLGLFLFGEKKFGKHVHFLSAVLVFIGSWISGFFIVATDAWMQHPVAYSISTDGSAQLTSFWGLLTNNWVFWQYFHTMVGAVVTASFVMASIGAYYLLDKKHTEFGKLFVRIGVIAGFIACLFQLFPSGDGQGKNIAEYQPVTLAAMEGLFNTRQGADLVILGQPNMESQTIDNPLIIPNVLSFLTYRTWSAEVKGLNAFQQNDWPENIPLLYYSYHIMVGLGTIFIAILLIAGVLLWRKKLYASRWMLWILMFSFPFPYIANTAGWTTAELGRQPWLCYGLMRTAAGNSPTVSAGNGLFTLLGFLGLYLVLGVLFIILVLKEINRGPEVVEGGERS
ncbi:MAG TPA: cytochrome ubiquinol oxidase subunit I [Candidatus Kapabacteria bacterium]|nr:cytochrome ubiquinol oxidase subunit I [Candidatus Kapabacteria bacterium]